MLPSLEELEKEKALEIELNSLELSVGPLRSYAKDAIELSRATKNHRGRPLGFKTLDTLLGGVSSGELIVISAATGVGKSTLAKTITYNLALQGRGSLWYSLEEPIWNFLQAFLGNDPDMKWESDGTLASVGKFPIYWPDKVEKVDFDMLRKNIRYAYLKYGIEHVFIDHLSYLLDSKAIEQSRSISIHIGDRLRALRQIALSTGVSIFLVAHIGKIEDGKEPTLNDLRDSSFVGQEADAILMLSRKKLNEPIPSTTAEGISFMERFSPIVRCNIEKARRTGARGAFDLIFANRLYFDPCESPAHMAIYQTQKDIYANTDKRFRSKAS